MHGAENHVPGIAREGLEVVLKNPLMVIVIPVHIAVHAVSHIQIEFPR